MTVSYSAEVATVKGYPTCFVRVLRRWRGSIYKVIYMDLMIFVALYYAIALVYRLCLNDSQQETFGNVAAYFSDYNTIIPLSFVMGFYVTIIVRRWGDQFQSVPWPDPVAVSISSLLRGQDERGRKMRRTVMRYICLSQVLTYSLISPKVKKRFPTYEHILKAGLLNENEKQIILTMDKAFPKHPKYWMPIVWAASILTRARHEGRIRDDFSLRILHDELNKFRQLCIVLLHYDTITVPLVYTQTVTLAVYLYFSCSLIAQQWINDDDRNEINRYIPAFVILEFVFYFGWLKVAESLICPFGEDDDDFEVNSWIDRNVTVSYLIVDEMHSNHPELLRDQYWDRLAAEIPVADDMPEYSTAHMDPKPQTQEEQEEPRLEAKPLSSSSTFESVTSSEQDQSADDGKENSETSFDNASETAFDDLREKRERQRLRRRHRKMRQAVNAVNETSNATGSAMEIRPGDSENDAATWQNINSDDAKQKKDE